MEHREAILSPRLVVNLELGDQNVKNFEISISGAKVNRLVAAFIVSVIAKLFEGLLVVYKLIVQVFDDGRRFVDASQLQDVQPVVETQ